VFESVIWIVLGVRERDCVNWLEWKLLKYGDLSSNSRSIGFEHAIRVTPKVTG
jgi:hypothetical protein